MATLYIHPGPYGRLMGPDSIAPKFVVLALNGRGRLLMLVPTGDLEHIRLLIFDHWIPMIQGTCVLSCGGTAEQRELLLHITLAFHAFVEGFPGVDLTNYYYFAGQLVEIALSTDTNEDVEPRLIELVEWLHDALPMNLFEGPHIPHVTDNDYEHPLSYSLAAGGFVRPGWWTSPRDVYTDSEGEDSSDGEDSGKGEGEGGSNDVGSNGSMPPLVDVSDSD